MYIFSAFVSHLVVSYSKDTLILNITKTYLRVIDEKKTPKLKLIKNGENNVQLHLYIIQADFLRFIFRFDILVKKNISTNSVLTEIKYLKIVNNADPNLQEKTCQI